MLLLKLQEGPVQMVAAAAVLIFIITHIDMASTMYQASVLHFLVLIHLIPLQEV